MANQQRKRHGNGQKKFEPASKRRKRHLKLGRKKKMTARKKHIKKQRKERKQQWPKQKKMSIEIGMKS